MSRAAALLRKGAKHKKTEEDNPIWQKKDWKGDTMVQFKSDGLWGYKSMQGLANDNPMASAVSSFKNLLGKKGSGATSKKAAPQFRVCSFNVLAQCYVNQIRFPYTLPFAL